MTTERPISSAVKLEVTGEVLEPQSLSTEELLSIPSAFQIADVSEIDPKRRGRAVRLAGLLERVKPKATARYLGLHASRDDFHASIPLEAVKDRAVVIFLDEGRPLSDKAGGPFRFFIPDHKQCRMDEIDECANVKFVDRIEFTAEKGFDNRPHDEEEHANLHAKEG